MPDHYYVYPAYLTKGAPRSLGRRIAAEAAVAEVTLEEIVAACRQLGLTASAEPDKHYPRQYHRWAGRVKVTKKVGVPKTRMLREIASMLHRQKGPAN
jgi:signal recognition particle subunit SEC65